MEDDQDGGQRLRDFLDWCADNAVELHPNLEIVSSVGTPRDDEQYAEIAIFVQSTATEGLNFGDIAASIPKTAILSGQSSSLASFDPTFVPCSIGGPNSDTASVLAMPQLALCLMHEFILGPALSRFWPYLATLPPRGIDLPRLWNLDRAEDGVDRGTSGTVGRLLRDRLVQDAQPSDEHPISNGRLYEYFWAKGIKHLETAHPGLVKNAGSGERASILRSLDPSLRLDTIYKRAQGQGFTPSELGELFIMATTLVSSRAFAIDYFHGPAMVPLADAFNHHPLHHVACECEDVVCSECGALFECEHDAGSVFGSETDTDAEMDGSKERTGIDQDQDQEDEPDTILLRAARPCQPGAEVFNTYGQLGNAQLLVRYGFAVRGNPHDRYTWPWPRTWPSSPSGVESEEALETAALLCGRADGQADRFALVNELAGLAARERLTATDTEPSSLLDITETEAPRGADRPLFLTQQGSIGLRLWLTALACALYESSDDPTRCTLSTLLRIHDEWRKADPCGHAIEPQARAVVRLAMDKVRRLVQRRLARSCEAVSDEALQAVMDGSSPSSRVGLSHARRGAALCISEERIALRRCLSKLDALENRCELE